MKCATTLDNEAAALEPASATSSGEKCSRSNFWLPQSSFVCSDSSAKPPYMHLCVCVRTRPTTNESPRLSERTEIGFMAEYCFCLTRSLRRSGSGQDSTRMSWPDGRPTGCTHCTNTIKVIMHANADIRRSGTAALRYSGTLKTVL